VTAQQVIDNLLNQPVEKELPPEPAAREIVFRGTFEEVNAYFYEREWSDGLPIVPPTIERSRSFSATPIATGAIAGHPAAGKSGWDAVGDGRQWRDGGLPSAVHAHPGCPRRSHGRSHLWGRAQRQYSGGGNADRPHGPIIKELNSL